MKALTYTKAHKLEQFALELSDVPTPQLRPHDVLVEVKALSLNPVDYKVRSSRDSTNGEPVILGWDFSGIVKALGAEAKGFKVGDQVFGAGDLMRSGSYAELLAVDSRIIALAPKSLDFAKAAALPLTSLTAWEALIERESELKLSKDSTVLIIGGAGGVGSAAIQILKAKTKSRVIATASRAETIEWSRAFGADETIDHRKGLKEELKRIGVDQVDVVFSTTHTDQYLKEIGEVLRPFGHFILIDDPKTLDITPYKRKSISVHWELMFTKTLFNHDVSSQGKILNEVSKLVDEGKLKSTANTVLRGLSVDHLKKAHEIAEKGTAIGKLVVTL